MAEFTRSYDITIDAPVHTAFDYCRDPRHLFEGWPQLQVTDVDISWFEDLVDQATAGMLNKNLNNMLAAIKAEVEDGGSPAD